MIARTRRRGLLAALFATVAACFVLASPAAGAITSGTIQAGDATQTGTLVRTGAGTASTCAAAKANPGLVPGIQRTYAFDSVTIMNSSGASECVTVALSSPVNSNLFAAAYLGSFDPANPLTNYLADPGENTGGGSKTFAFVLAAGQTAVIVVSEPTSVSCSAPSNSCAWTLDVTTAALAVTLRSFTAAYASRVVTLRWQTASELDTVGYNLYGLVHGKRVKLNRGLIAAKGMSGGSYSFRYRLAKGHAVPGRYWLQVVNRDGSRTWYAAGPVRRS